MKKIVRKKTTISFLLGGGGASFKAKSKNTRFTFETQFSENRFIIVFVSWGRRPPRESQRLWHFGQKCSPSIYSFDISSPLNPGFPTKNAAARETSFTDQSTVISAI